MEGWGAVDVCCLLSWRSSGRVATTGELVAKFSCAPAVSSSSGLLTCGSLGDWFPQSIVSGRVVSRNFGDAFCLRRSCHVTDCRGLSASRWIVGGEGLQGGGSMHTVLRCSLRQMRFEPCSMEATG